MIYREIISGAGARDRITRFILTNLNIIISLVNTAALHFWFLDVCNKPTSTTLRRRSRGVAETLQTDVRLEDVEHDKDLVKSGVNAQIADFFKEMT